MQLHVFARGHDNQLTQKFYTGREWLGWFSLGGALRGAPAVTTYEQVPMAPDNVLVTSTSAASGTEPSLAVSGATVVAAWNNFPSSQERVAYSTDSGSTWTLGAIAPPSGYAIPWGDPGVTTDGAGTFHFTYLTAQTPSVNKIRIAADRSGNGQNWSGSTIISNANDMDDKPLIAARGNLVVAAWTDFSDGQITLARSTDGGQTWNNPVRVDHNHTDSTWRWGAVPIVGDGNEVYVAWNDSRPKEGDRYLGGIYHARSTDGGQTFTEVQVARHFDDAPDMQWYPQPPGAGTPPRSGFRVKLMPAFARNPTNDELYLAWQDNQFNGKGKNPYDIVFTRSTDHGRTWSAVRRASDVSGQFHYFPWLSCAPNGRLDLVYYSRRLDPNEIANDLFYQWSTDGGRTWSRGRRITTVSSAPLGFMGDYISCDSDNDAVYTVWTDTRNGVNDIYFARAVPDLVTRAPMP